MSAKLNIFLGEGQLFSARDPQLQVDKVQPGDYLRDRVFHLKAGVHFEKIKIAIGIDKKLYGAGVRVPSRSGGLDSDRAHALAHIRINNGRGRFLDDFLMAALHRTLSFAQVNDVAMFVTKHLNLNMPRVLNKFLKINLAIIEGAQGFALRGFKTGFQVGGLVDQTHSLAATAGRGLDHDRKSNLGRHCFCFSHRESARRSGDHGDTRGFMAVRARVLEPINSIAEGGGPMNLIPTSAQARANWAFSERNP